jgi:hypothetical protein
MKADVEIKKDIKIQAEASPWVLLIVPVTLGLVFWAGRKSVKK